MPFTTQRRRRPNIADAATRSDIRELGIVRRAFVLRDADIGHRVVSGGLYTVLGIALRTILTIGSVSVLARLLTPADFGHVAMAMVVIELAGLFSNFGFSSVLIQRRVLARLHLDTVFWASAGLGALLAATVFGASFLASEVFKSPITGDLLRVLSINFLISSLTVTHEAILARLMMFRQIFFLQIGAVFIRACAAIFLAYTGFGVWSLALASIVSGVASLLVTIVLVPYFARLRFNYAYIRSIWRTSSSYFGSGILFYINTNADLFLVGRQLGATSLGYYQNARSLTDEVRSRLAIPLQRVLFPAFSAMQHDVSRLQQSVIRSGRLLAAVIFPVGTGIFCISPELVPLLYGDQWLPMIPALQMLALASIPRASAAIATPIFNSQNRVGLAFQYNTVGTLIMIMGVTLTIPYGIGAVAKAIAFSSLYMLVMLRVAFRLIGLNSSTLLSVFFAPAVASSLMAVSIFALRAKDVIDGTQLIGIVLGYIAIGAFVYSASLFLIASELRADARSVISKLFKSR